MKLTNKEIMEYLNNQNFAIKDKQTFLNMFSKSEIENLYFYCIDQRVYIKTIDRTRLNWLKYAYARTILLNRLDYLDFKENYKEY